MVKDQSQGKWKEKPHKWGTILNALTPPVVMNRIMYCFQQTLGDLFDPSPFVWLHPKETVRISIPFFKSYTGQLDSFSNCYHSRAKMYNVAVALRACTSPKQLNLIRLSVSSKDWTQGPRTLRITPELLTKIPVTFYQYLNDNGIQIPKFFTHLLSTTMFWSPIAGPTSLTLCNFSLW